MKHFHKYLYGRKFVPRTDHSALQWLLNFKDPEGQVACWIQQRQEYDFQIQHCKGTSHRNADGLSRRLWDLECKQRGHMEKNDVYIQKLMLMQPTNGRQEQLDDDDTGRNVRAKEQDIRPRWEDISDLSRELKILWAQQDSLHIDHGILYHVRESENGQNEHLQIVVSRSVSGSHSKVTETIAKLQGWFYYPS